MRPICFPAGTVLYPLLKGKEPITLDKPTTISAESAEWEMAEDKPNHTTFLLFFAETHYAANVAIAGGR